MIDANTQALNNYLDAQEKQELELESFESEIESDLLEIEDMIRKVKKIAKDYNGYDFSEELKEILKDTI